MNAPPTSYRSRARRYWSRWLPERYYGVDDPDSFFAELGDQAAERVEEAWRRLEDTDTPTPGEHRANRNARLRRLRAAAEAQVLRELLLLPPEPHAQGTSAENLGDKHTGAPGDTCTALIEGRINPDELTDHTRHAVAKFAGPDFLIAVGLSPERLHAPTPAQILPPE